MTKLPWLMIAALTVLAHSNPPARRYSTYLGLVATATGVVADSAGYAYATGLTHPAFMPPCTLPVLGPAGSNGPYGYVTKIAPDGAVVWTACLAVPSGRAIALDGSGSIYAAGGTTLTKLSPNGDKIVSSIMIAQTEIDAVALDKAGNVYAAGMAQAGLATTPGAFKAACDANSPCPAGFVAKFDAAGNVQYATYVDSRATVHSMAVDSHGAAWITGVGVSNNSFGPYSFSFIDKLDPDGAHLSFDQRYGGTRSFHSTDSGGGAGVAVDSRDNAYAVSERNSVGVQYGYLLKVDPAGNFLYTDLGKAVPTAIAIDSAGRIYVSVEQAFHGGAALNCGDAVTPSSLTVYGSDGSTILTSTYQPGQSLAVAADGSGNAYIVGRFGDSFYVTRYDTAENSTLHLDCLVNAASPPAGDGSVAAGEIITLFGKGFAPRPQLTIAFDGYPAPILYASTGQSMPWCRSKWFGRAASLRW